MGQVNKANGASINAVEDFTVLPCMWTQKNPPLRPCLCSATGALPLGQVVLCLTLGLGLGIGVLQGAVALVEDGAADGAEVAAHDGGAYIRGRLDRIAQQTVHSSDQSGQCEENGGWGLCWVDTVECRDVVDVVTC